MLSSNFFLVIFETVESTFSRIKYTSFQLFPIPYIFFLFLHKYKKAQNLQCVANLQYPQKNRCLFLATKITKAQDFNEAFQNIYFGE